MVSGDALRCDTALVAVDEGALLCVDADAGDGDDVDERGEPCFAPEHVKMQSKRCERERLRLRPQHGDQTCTDLSRTKQNADKNEPPCLSGNFISGTLDSNRFEICTKPLIFCKK
jgi:hypothetical protein